MPCGYTATGLWVGGGYEDLNDHGTLRNDIAFQAALESGQLPIHPMCRFIPPGAFMAFGYKWVFPGAPTLVGPSVNRPPAARSIAN